MKQKIGPKLSLYPMPLVVIGTMNGDKPTWTLVGHTGIIGHDHILISLFDKHFINNLVKKNQTISINYVNDENLVASDYCGIASGIKTDKSEVFEYELTKNNTPIIKSSKLVMECKVEQNINMVSFDNFICSILNTFVEEDALTDGKIDYSKVKPILFEMPNYGYYELGKYVGKGAGFGKNYGKN